MKITIIGYGEIGQAAYKLLKANKELVVEVWDKKGGQGQKSLAETVSLSEVVFICVPSWCVREVLADIKKYLAKNALVVCLAKGIEPADAETMAGEEKKERTMDAVLQDELSPNQPFCILSGPMLAEELSAGKKGFAVAVSKNKKDFLRLAEIFSGSNLILEYSNDLRGVALCGVLKNIYALGFGIADGLELGSNAKGKLSVLAIREMKKIVKLLGGKDKTVFGVAGIGDFVATAFSRYSRNREAGEELAKTGVCCLESEGYKSIVSIIKLIGNADDLPFLNALKLIILDGRAPAQVFNSLLR